MLGNTISEAYQNGFNSSLEHRLDLEITYLEHLLFMLACKPSVNSCPIVISSIENRLLYLKNESKILTEKKR